MEDGIESTMSLIKNNNDNSINTSNNIQDLYVFIPDEYNSKNILITNNLLNTITHSKRKLGKINMFTKDENGIYHSTNTCFTNGEIIEKNNF